MHAAASGASSAFEQLALKLLYVSGPSQVGAGLAVVMVLKGPAEIITSVKGKARSGSPTQRSRIGLQGLARRIQYYTAI